MHAEFHPQKRRSYNTEVIENRFDFTWISLVLVHFLLFYSNSHLFVYFFIVTVNQCNCVMKFTGCF